MSGPRLSDLPALIDAWYQQLPDLRLDRTAGPHTFHCHAPSQPNVHAVTMTPILGRVTVEIALNGRTTSGFVNQVLDEAWQWVRELKTIVVNSRVHSTRKGLQAVTQDAVVPLMLDPPTD